MNGFYNVMIIAVVLITRRSVDVSTVLSVNLDALLEGLPNSNTCRNEGEDAR